jgi:hypothetical protein
MNGGPPGLAISRGGVQTVICGGRIKPLGISNH